MEQELEGPGPRPGHYLQAFLLVAVGIWLVYQLGHTYKRRAVAVEISGNNGVHRLCSKSLIKFAGVASGGIVAGNDDAVEWKPRRNNDREEEEGEDDDGLFGYDGGATEFSILRMARVKKTMNWIEALFVESTLPAARKMMVVDQLVNGAADDIDMGRERNSTVDTSNPSTHPSSSVFQW